MKRIIFGSLLAVSSNIMAADWKYIGSAAQNNGDFYMDANSFKYDAKSKMVIVWTKTDNYTTPRKYSTIPEDTAVANKTKMAFYCSLRKTKRISGVTYGESGRVINSFDVPDQRFSEVIPDTMAEAMFDVACKNPSKGLSIAPIDLSKFKYYNNPYKPFPEMENFDSLDAYYDGIRDWFDLPAVIPKKYIDRYGSRPELATYNTVEDWLNAIRSYYNQIKIDTIVGK